MADQLLHKFTSHIAGKNAQVSIFDDRVEWARPRGISGGKITAGILTGGVSMLATGVKGGKAGTEMIPVKSITSVATKRDGMLNTIVSIITSGNSIDFRVSHNEASIVATIVRQLILGQHPSQSFENSIQNDAPQQPQFATQPPTAPSSPDVMAQLTQLGQLKEQGILTQAEFDAKKAELLGRL